MIRVTFLSDKGKIRGFHIEGHASAGTAGNDIVCAAVSSAAYLVANTVTDIIKANAEASAGDGSISLVIEEGDAAKCEAILKGFELHINELKHQYPKNIKVIYGGCKNA